MMHNKVIFSQVESVFEKMPEPEKEEPSTFASKN